MIHESLYNSISFLGLYGDATYVTLAKYGALSNYKGLTICTNTHPGHTEAQWVAFK